MEIHRRFQVSASLRHNAQSREFGTTVVEGDPWITALTSWYYTILDLVPESELLRRMILPLQNMQPWDLQAQLDSLASAHLRMLETGDPSFIREAAAGTSSLLKGLLTFLEKRIGYISSEDIPSVTAWRQVLVFLTRTSFGGPNIPSSSEAWVQLQSNLCAQAPRDFSWISTCLSRYVSEGADDLVVGHLEPRHGPGSVVIDRLNLRTSRVDVNSKDSFLRITPALAQMCELMRVQPSELGLTQYQLGPALSVLNEQPKSFKSTRLIAIEETSSMYVQQALKSGLYWWIHHDAFLRDHVDLHNASKVKHLVSEGSKTGRYATIDLSSASDMVTEDHVRGLQYLLPRVVHLAHLARSAHVGYRTPNREKRIVTPYRTFATMGNATCFPFETLVFVAMCIEAIQETGGDPRKSKFRVYGDDIVIEERFSAALVRLLTSSGFSVNRDKSFFMASSRFRESCGYEFYRGFDVTPFRLPRSYDSRHLDFKTTQMWVDINNNPACSYALKRRIKQEVIVAKRKPVPFSSDGAVGFKCEFGAPSNSHLVKRWMPHAFCYGYAYFGQRVPTKDRHNGSLALYEWLSAAHGRERSDDCVTPLLKSRITSGDPITSIEVFFDS